MAEREKLFRVTFVLVFVFLCCNVFCDSQTLQMYKQQFSMANSLGKAQILENAASDHSLSDSLGEFYEYALQQAIENFESNENDPNMVNILIAIGRLGRGNRAIIENINDFLLQKDLLYKSGERVNYALISAGIAAVMEFGDSSSYPVLFEIISGGYPEIITLEAYGAFELLPQNYTDFLFGVIEKNRPEEKLIALRIGINSEKLILSERAQLAELALEQSLIAHTNEDGIFLTDLRYEAAQALIPLRWARASPLAVRHYYRVQEDFQRNAALKDRFLEAIELLGSVGNSDAALPLILRLGLINTQMERTRRFDADITLAIVQALGLIGDRSAYYQLFYIGNLSYSENIIAAAKEAIARLKW